MKASPSASSGNLRQQALARMKTKNNQPFPTSPEETAHLLEELHLYQAELEVQNEELRALQVQLEVAYEEYRSLFEFAPVGYFILDSEANILKVNPEGANQLGVNSFTFVEHSFNQYITRESQDTFFRHRRQAMKGKNRCSCEVQMLKAGGGSFYAHLQSIVVPTEAEGYQLQIAVIDITERKHMEQENEQLVEALRHKSSQVQALGRRLAEVRELEQQKLAQELHDRVGQNLTALGFQLDYLKEKLAEHLPAGHPLYARLGTARELANETTDRVRDVLAELRPPMLDEYGLIAALEWYGEQFARWSGVAVTVQGEEILPRPAPLTENTLLRIAQEALTNVAKHAQATEVVISVEVDRDIVYMTITDNGVGLEVSRQNQAPAHKSWGLLIMAERAEMIGGLCRIDSQPHHGTRVMVTAPCAPEG